MQWTSSPFKAIAPFPIPFHVCMILCNYSFAFLYACMFSVFVSMLFYLSLFIGLYTCFYIWNPPIRLKRNQVCLFPLSTTLIHIAPFLLSTFECIFPFLFICNTHLIKCILFHTFRSTFIRVEIDKLRCFSIFVSMKKIIFVN